MKMKKKKGFSKAIAVGISVAMGAACGLLAGKAASIVTGKAAGDVSFAETIKGILIILALFYLAILLQTVIHESGHLVMGLLTGYRFLSFRIGSRMLIKKDGKWTVKRLSLAGTGGQCLMAPPPVTEEKTPYVLYNLGGSLFNMASAALFLVPVACGRAYGIPRIFCIVTAVVGLGTALQNGIPLQVGGIVNDGYNAKNLGKSAVGLKAFRRQLEMNAQLADGARLREMPREWFAMPDEGELDNMMVASQAVVYCGLLMDELRFPEALERMEKLVYGNNAVLGLHKNTMKCDMIYCELVGEGRREKLTQWKTPGLDKFMKTMKNYPSILRTQYAWALLYEKDEKKAEAIMEHFQKIEKTYPYSGDIRSERELMEYCSCLQKQMSRL